MAFKDDDSFLRFLSMGARGAAAVSDDLSQYHGHEVVELERYAMSNKLWSTKLKRLRLPDLMCLRCGLRIEARAKSSLEIKLSDSDTPGREWDSGMRPDDLYAFVHCVPNDDGPLCISKPQYFSAAELRAARECAKLGARKAASQGSEIDLKWPARVPKQAGEVLAVADHEVVTMLANGRRQTYRIPPTLPAYIYVQPGDRFDAEGTFVLGVVRAPASMDCKGIWDFASHFDAESALDRYAAVKAASSLGGRPEIRSLEAIAGNENEDPRIRLEAIGSLASLDPDAWTQSLEDIGAGNWNRADLAMEAVFILSELGTNRAIDSLSAIAGNGSLDEEPRAASVWGLGCCGADRSDLVVRFIGDASDLVAVHAIAALDDLPQALVPSLQNMLSGDDRAAAAATEVLVRHSAVGALLDSAGATRPGRLWARCGLGMLPPELILPTLEDDVDHLADVLAPMWMGSQRSWLRGDQERQLDLLTRQQVCRPRNPIRFHASVADDCA